MVSLSAQLQQLREQFAQKTSEQLDLKAKADLMERRLTAASKLIAGLSSERTRWTADMQVGLVLCVPLPAQQLMLRIADAIGNVICSASCQHSLKSNCWPAVMHTSHNCEHDVVSLQPECYCCCGL